MGREGGDEVRVRDGEGRGEREEVGREGSEEKEVKERDGGKGGEG